MSKVEIEEKLRELEGSHQNLRRQHEELAASQAKLEYERQRYQELFNLAPDSYIVTDLNGQIEDVNLAACRLLQQTHDFLVGLTLVGFFALEDQRQILELLAQFKVGSVERVAHAEAVVKLRSQEHIPCALVVNVIAGEAESLAGLRWLLRDIQASRKAEAALREREHFARKVIESSLNGIYIYDLEQGRTIFINAEYTRLTGYKLADVIVLNREAFWALFHPEDKRQIRAHVEQLRQARDGDILEIEYRGKTKDGQWIWFLSRDAVFERNSQGRVTQLIGTFLDISQHKRAEAALRESEQELEQIVAERTAKLREALGELEAFSYSIAHDMRAPLRSMQGFARLLVEEHAGQLKPEGQLYLQRIMASSDRLDRLIQDVLNYSRIVRDELPLEPVDLGPLIKGILDTYPNLQSSKAVIRLEEPLPTVIGNAAALTQVISNLLGNAVKFVPPNTMPQVRVWAELVERMGGSVDKWMNEGESALAQPTTNPPIHQSTDPTPLSTHPWIHPSSCGQFVRLWVEDNGIGIPKNSKQRIFEMLIRLNRAEVYEGTGIGLAIVRKAVERMGGEVGVVSEEGQGSRFWVTLRRQKIV